MAYFATLDENNKVTNIIVADSQEIAEEVTGLPCVEYTEENPAIIGLGYSDGFFEQLPPPVVFYEETSKPTV